MGFDVDKYLELAWQGKHIDKEAIKVFTMKVQNLLIHEDNMIRVKAPVALVGDIHGQFYDLLELFACTGKPPWTSFIFLGDFVDRGNHSIEVMNLLCLLKLKYPNRIFMIRGNHETRNTNNQYGFSNECRIRFGDMSVWQSFNNLFDYLPICALVNEKVFCVHGGLSPQIETFADIEAINRFEELPAEGPVIDLMWSDPKEDESSGFKASERGAGYLFGKDIVEKFMQANGLTKIVRAHQICQEGYMKKFDGKFITVWSAPNYCYKFKNDACALELDENLEEKFNMFTWSKENEQERLDQAVEKLQNFENQFFS